MLFSTLSSTSLQSVCSAVIPSFVDDHFVLVAKLPNLFFELAQAWLVHRTNVNITNAPLRKLVNLLPPLFHPTLITQIRISVGIDCFDASLPRSFVARFVIEGEFDFALETIVEPLPILIAGLYLLAADRDQVIANFDFYPIFVGRAIFVNVGHTIASRG